MVNVAVFKSDEEIIIVGLDIDGNPLDRYGTLFGANSKRDIKDFHKTQLDSSRGTAIIIQPSLCLRIG